MEVRGFEVEGAGASARVAALEEGVTDARIAADVPTDATLLGALDLEDGIVLVEPGEMAHLKSIASEAGVALQAVGGERSTRGTVASYRDQVRRAAGEEDLDAQYELLAPLFDELTAIEVAAALSALLRRKTPPPAEARVGTAPPPPGKPASFVRLFVSMGSKDNIRPGDLVGAITGESSVQGDRIGRIDIRDTFSVIEVDARDADRVIATLNGTTMRGRSVRVDYDRKTTPSTGPRPSGSGPRSSGSGPRSSGPGGPRSPGGSGPRSGPGGPRPGPGGPRRGPPPRRDGR
jgi:ATP-dependent RNA helicase DeaD